MKHARPFPAPNTLPPGHYLFWQQRTYQVVALDPDNALLLHVQPLGEGPGTTLSLLDLLAIPRTSTSAPLFAPTLEALHQQIEEQYGGVCGTMTDDLPKSYVIKARMVTSIVTMVRRLVSEDERQAKARNEAIAHQQAIRRALFRLSRITPAQFHFVDTCLLLYYGNTRSTKKRVYTLSEDILKRTKGYWVNPARCGATVPENLVTELLDLKIPMQAILDNPEKKVLLTPIEMPSTGWFSGYTRYIEAQPDQGEHIITERLGKGMWEQYHLVFDTFVRRAQFPLQYVFADHWLLDAFIVDEETRTKPSRLWLTLLIDAYSRSIVGMALLYEDPCIESIQQALKHAIWEKSSHTKLGIEQEWACFGIPLQLFLDNAWAHHSHSLENLARVISRNGVYNSIDLVFRPPYKGRYGAIIERLFKNFSGQVKELAAGAIASPDPKDLRAAARNACLLYPDMNRLLHQLILRYQHTPHRELQDRTPHEVWSQGVQSSGLPLVPPFTPAMDRLFLRMYPQTRHVASQGIPAFGLHYWSTQLGGIERVDREGHSVAYNFRYDPTDISRISLFRNGDWIGDGYARELQLADGSHQHLSLAEWNTAKRLVASNEAETAGNTAAELAFVTDLKALDKRRAQEKKAAQRTREKPESPPIQSREKPMKPVPDSPLDEETQRVLRFLHQ